MKAEVYAGARQSYQGALQTLLDHPAIVGVLNEILSEDPFVRDDCYGFRCEGSFTTVRPPGWDVSERGDNGLPHVVRPPATGKRHAVSGRGWQNLCRINARRLGTGGGQIRTGCYFLPQRFTQSALQLWRSPTRIVRTSVRVTMGGEYARDDGRL